MSQKDKKVYLNQPLISAKEVKRVFGRGEMAVIAVNGINLDIYPGEFLTLTGRSGSGKTTLLNILGGLDRPTSGAVFFENCDITKMKEADLIEMRRHKIAFVFQSFGLMPLLSAYENVELPLHIAGVKWTERREKSIGALEQVGLGSRAKHRPYELSGGEQQRVAIARALVSDPVAVFADEPTGELDMNNAISIATILRDIAAQKRITIISATHDLIVAQMASRNLELVDGIINT